MKTEHISSKNKNSRKNNLKIYNYSFRSESSDILLESDSSIKENKEFTFQLLKPNDHKPAEKVVLLLHGFNEKSWDKYLPWGESICKSTGSAVLFFPLAFHMQRAPESWSERREMFQLSKSRAERNETIRNSSLSNAAISKRIEEKPERIIHNGLESYFDVVQLLREAKKGHFKQIGRNFSINIFAYSIGGLLAEVLKLSNPDGLFTKSRICLFCSGPVFRKMNPESRYILDSKANESLQNFLKDKPENHLPQMNDTIRKTFLSLLDYNILPEFRETLLKKNAKDFYAISLKKDTVIPSAEVRHTLQGSNGDINIKVEDFDFPYSYTHVNPFKDKTGNQEPGKDAFTTIFKRVGIFLGN